MKQSRNRAFSLVLLAVAACADRAPDPAAQVEWAASGTQAIAAGPNLTQVIDGLPQVVAPGQLIVSCNPAVLPGVCNAVLAAVGATVAALGVGGFTLAVLPAGLGLQPVLDTLRASPAIASAEPNRVVIGSTLHPQTWHFPAVGAPGD